MLCCVLDLQRLRGWEDVDEELCEMHVEDQSERAEGRLSLLNLFTFRSLRWQLLSVIFMNMGQQLSGVNAVSTTYNTFRLISLQKALYFKYVLLI